MFYFPLIVILLAGSSLADDIKPILREVPTSLDPNFNEKDFKKTNKFAVDSKPKGSRKQEATAGEVPLKFQDQIVGGKIASKGKFPWQVLLTVEDEYSCGGSLIDPRWVLTAAHCCYNFKKIVTSMGLVNRTAKDSSRVDIEVESIHVHPSYDDNYLTNDICLLKLKRAPDTSGVFVTTVRLPKVSDAKKSLVNVKGDVSGFGKTADNAYTSDVLKFVSRTVIDNKECAKNYGTVTVNGALLCISNTDKQGTCQGDSGGPYVMVESDKKFTQIGLVSFGSAASCVTYPSGFTRVSAHLGWIASVTGIQPRN